MPIKRFLEKAKRKDENIFIDIHHVLCKTYGWIPFEELKKIPIPTVFNLLNRIEKDTKEMEKAYRKIRKPRRR